MSFRPFDLPEHYFLKVYLSPEAIAFLESKYPNLDPELGVVHLVEEARQQVKRTAAARVQVVELSTPAHPKVPLPSAKSIKLAPVGQRTPPSQPLANPIGALQEHCQQSNLPLPEYKIESCAEGFACEVKAVGQSASSTGANKKTAKSNAATVLLAALKLL